MVCVSCAVRTEPVNISLTFQRLNEPQRRAEYIRTIQARFCVQLTKLFQANCSVRKYTRFHKLLDYVWLEQNKKGIAATTLTHHQTVHLTEFVVYK
jgi:hypothetical protein